MNNSKSTLNSRIPLHNYIVTKKVFERRWLINVCMIKKRKTQKKKKKREWCELVADRKLLRDSHLRINKKSYP